MLKINRPLGWTTLEEAQQLVKAGLPVETADMYWAPDADTVVPTPYITKTDNETLIPAYKGAIPCWSLGALVSLLPEVSMDGIRCYPVIRKPIYTGQWQTAYVNGLYVTHHYETSIEAVIEMIIWLLNNKFYEQEKC